MKKFNLVTYRLLQAIHIALMVAPIFFYLPLKNLISPAFFFPYFLYFCLLGFTMQIVKGLFLGFDIVEYAYSATPYDENPDLDPAFNVDGNMMCGWLDTEGKPYGHV